MQKGKEILIKASGNTTTVKKIRGPVSVIPKRNSVAGAKAKSSAKKQANRIMSSLHEAQQIHAGKIKGETFDEFLSEF
jgi:hypothetical protein